MVCNPEGMAQLEVSLSLLFFITHGVVNGEPFLWSPREGHGHRDLLVLLLGLE